MSYIIGSKTIKLKCNTCGTTKEAAIKDGNLATMRGLWEKAKGWTSTSEHHYCKKCS